MPRGPFLLAARIDQIGSHYPLTMECVEWSTVAVAWLGARPAEAVFLQLFGKRVLMHILYLFLPLDVAGLAGAQGRARPPLEGIFGLLLQPLDVQLSSLEDVQGRLAPVKALVRVLRFLPLFALRRPGAIDSVLLRRGGHDRSLRLKSRLRESLHLLLVHVLRLLEHLATGRGPLLAACRCLGMHRHRTELPRRVADWCSLVQLQLPDFGVIADVRIVRRGAQLLLSGGELGEPGLLDLACHDRGLLAAVFQPEAV